LGVETSASFTLHEFFTYSPCPVQNKGKGSLQFFARPGWVFNLDLETKMHAWILKEPGLVALIMIGMQMP
jgi:hypothetical protein